MGSSTMAILSDDLKLYGLPGLNSPGYTFWATFSKDRRGIKSEEPAYENIINTRDGVTVALDNDRERDKAEQQLNWSELMYQAWQVTKAEDDKSGVATGGTLSTLQYSVQMNVINDQAVQILELAYSNMGYPGQYSGDETWRRWSKLDIQTKNWWLALLGTDNCKGRVYLLTQHAVEVGGRRLVIFIRSGGMNGHIFGKSSPFTLGFYVSFWERRRPL